MLETGLAFLSANWVSIVFIVMVVVLAAWMWKQGYKRNVYVLLLQIVNEVEEKYGKEEQDVKYDIILGKLYPKLPKPFTWLVSLGELDDMVTETIDSVQYWLEQEIQENQDK